MGADRIEQAARLLADECKDYGEMERLASILIGYASDDERGTAWAILEDLGACLYDIHDEDVK